MTKITREDIRALKDCSTLCIHEEFIRAIKETKSMKSEYKFDVDSNVKSDEAKCFSYHSLYDWKNCQIKTIINLLKVDDDIKLSWNKNGYQTDNHKLAGFDADSLEIIITRGKKEFIFLVNVSVCPKNTARMIISKE